jgi:hypothetical protein
MFAIQSEANALKVRFFLGQLAKVSGEAGHLGLKM